MIFIKSKLTPEPPGRKKEGNNMSKEQIQTLIAQVETTSIFVTGISNELPERPSRRKLEGQLSRVLTSLQSIQSALEAENNRIVASYNSAGERVTAGLSV